MARFAARRPIAAFAAAAVAFTLLPSLTASAQPDADASELPAERPPAVSDPLQDDWLSRADGLVIRPSRQGAAALKDTSDIVSGLARAEAEVGRAVGGGFQRIDLDEELPIDELEALAAELVASGLAVSAEPDYRVVPLTMPDDQHYPHQWHLHGRWLGAGGWPTTGLAYGINVEDAWRITEGSPDVIVAVLDTGGLPHPDITEPVPVGYDMITDPGTARDGDGRDSNPTDEGDWVAAGECPRDPSDPPNPAKSSGWHGLHVAGTIGASTDNGTGVAGVDQRAGITHVRVLGRCGGISSDISAGIRWAAGLPVPGVPTNPEPADVLNLSLGGIQSCSAVSGMQAAVNDAVAAGAVVVVAGGNSNSATPGFPADCQGVISVAATSPAGDRATYSNYGSWVDISAPGGDGRFAGGGVLSTHNSGTTTVGAPTYGWMAGTSMAAPHVSGVVSLMLAANPGLTADELLEILRATAQPFPAAGYGYDCSSDPTATFHCGAGIVDAGAAVAAAAAAVSAPDTAPPPAPVLTSSNGDLRVGLTWNAVPDPSQPVTYRVYRSTGSSCSTANTLRFTGVGATSYTDTGLTHGTTYRYCATATDAVGNVSARSDVISVTARDRTGPAAPNLKVTAGTERVSVSWPAVSDPTGPVRYHVFRSTGSSCSTSNTRVHNSTTRSFTDTGLTGGRTYRYCAIAIDGAGNRSKLSAVRSATPSAAAVPSFTDVKAGSTHEAGIIWMAQEGITGGCTSSGTTFCPDDPVTRAQMASFISRALGYRAGSTNIFSDVDPNNTHAGAIGALHREKVTLGCTTGSNLRYCPTESVTRAQMASFLTRAYGIGDGSRTIFADVQSSSGHAGPIGAMYREKITLGCATSPLRYCPDAPITRGEMATLMYRASRR